jgi:hypothetical protein
MLNSVSINGAAINNFTQNGGGAFIKFEQKVTSSASAGTFISIAQTVKLNASANAGKFISIEQIVKTIGSGKFITFAQDVRDSTPTFFARNQYDCDIYIAGLLLPKSQICSEVVIKKSEGVASDCKFSITPPTGVQSPENYQGQSIFVNLTNSSGKIYRAFTGFIDTPTLDLIEKKITFACTDRRQTQINALPSAVVSSIGQYSVDVFGTAKDSADELANRLKTVAASFDFDNYGNWQLTPWKPKSTADFVLSNSAIFYRNPDVTYTNRTKTVNTVNIAVNYKYQRLHQQVCNVTWSGYQNFLSDWFNQGTPSFPQRTSITSAANSTSWAPIGPITFVPLWPAGGYGSVVWQPNTVVNTYTARTAITYLTPPVYNPAAPMVWPDGTKHAIETFILDPNGKKIYDVATTTITDTSSPLCRGAQWAAAKKFAQAVTELYTIKISSPQGVSRFGIIDTHETVTINDPYNTAIWTGDKSVYNSSATPGTALNYTTDSAGYAKGASSITMPAGGTGTFNVGNQFTITNDPSGMYYTVTATVTAPSGGTLTFAPGLKGVVPAGQFNAINLVPSQTNNNNANFYINQKPLYPRLISSLSVVCQRAQTTLLAAHRDVSVNFRRLIWPEIDLIHTVQTTATAIASQGKVHSITHTINCGTGEAYSDIMLKLSRAYSTDAQSVFNITVPPYENSGYIGSPTQISLGTHYGQNPDITKNPSVVNWNGYIGNAQTGTSGQGNVRTNYPQSFIVDYPAIPLILTQARTVTQNTPGTNSGVHTDAAGYLLGVTSITIAAGGTGSLLQGDSITIAGDSSNQVYIVQNDILNVAGGAILSISPGLGANLSAATHNITSSAPGNIFTIAVPNDSLTVTY